MAIQDKAIAGIMLVHSSLGILWTYWVASQIGFPAIFLTANLALAAIGIVAGIGWLRHGRWAIYLAIGFFLVQLVHVLTPTFQWSFTLGFNFNISFGWFTYGEFSLNLVALAMLAWSSARAFAPNEFLQVEPRSGPS